MSPLLGHVPNERDLPAKHVITAVSCCIPMVALDAVAASQGMPDDSFQEVELSSFRGSFAL